MNARSAIHIRWNLQTAFIEQTVRLRKPDYDFGVRVGAIKPDDHVNILAGVPMVNTHSQPEKVWLMLYLTWLSHQNFETTELQEKIDNLYADFDYPEEMSFLV